MRTEDIPAAVLAILGPLLPPGAAPDLDTSLADRGLESLAATRLWFQLRTAFGVDIPVQWLGRCATVADLVARVQEEARPEPVAGPATSTEATGTAAAGERHEPFPLSDLQQAYLISKDPLLGDDPIGCHVYREFEVDDLDVPRLRAAWQRVVDRHDMLRAVLTDDGRQRVQERASAPEIAVQHGADVGATRDRLSHHRYEPGVWPMHTLAVTRPPTGPSTVHVSIDAILTDGHGLALMLDDLWACYADSAYRPAAPAVTVRECVLSLAAQRRGPEHRRHLDYWAERLAGLPGGPDLVRPAGPEPHGNRRTALTGKLDRAQWTVLNDLARRWEVSPTAVVLTLFAEAFGWHRAGRPFSVVLTTNDRTRLPGDAETVAGPFTSSLVLPLGDTLDRPLPQAVAAVHAQLWEALGHAAVSGVAALRAVRGRDRTAPTVELPVVFTSLLGTAQPARAATYALSQTTGVALDHQMWEEGGELHLRWDVATGRFAPGTLERLFATFVNALADLSLTEPELRGLNELQQAYFVPRSLGEAAPWDGCQVSHSFEVDDLDPARLESAWLRLVRAHDALRTVVTHDGVLAVGADTPSRRHIPVIDLTALPDPGAFLAELRDRTTGQAMPLGRGPQSEVFVTTDGSATAIVHLVTDLTVLDGRSIHFLVRELLRLYADPSAESVPAAPHAQYRSGRGNDPAAIEHWRARVAALAGGPALAKPATPVARLPHERLEGRLTGWRAIRARIERAGLHPDDILAAAFTEALAGSYPAPFSVPVVRWTDDTARYRPGEYTALSWVTRTDATLPLWEQAARFRAVLDEDTHADAVNGLTELRRRVMRERRGGHFDLPVVYTGILDLSEQPLPPGVRLGPWLTCTPDVSLDCIAIDDGDELRFYWDTVPAHFPPGQLTEMFERYRRLLAATADDSAVRRHRILYEWNDTDRPFPAEIPAHRLFERQAHRTPDAIALRWAGGTMTYRELNARANRIAHGLRARGVGPEVAVGISVPRGPAMVAAVFGVLKAGGFYVPLEPSLPAARAATILDDAAIGLVLVGADRQGWPVPAGVAAVHLETLDASEDDPEPVGGVDDTAYVIFTSGSTGKPKGVAVAHRPLLNLLDWCERTHGFGPADVGLCVTSLGFDLSVFDILGLLSYGASLYIADEREQRDPDVLLDVLLREPVTFWNSAPTTLNQLAPLFAGRRDAAGTDTLRLVYLSGDYTPLTLPDEVRALFGGARIVSLGGATEATVWSNWFDVGTIDPAWRSIPYGRPIANARYYVLDEAMEPCPVGVEGDLFVGGECLALGYYRQPELTGERFIADPFDVRPGGRLYRTGDRASFFPDGNICFLGRADGQVKIRGFRVELGEIEHRLRAHTEVKDAVVLARADRTGDRKLVAYVVPATATPPTVAALRRHAADGLPDYMVPNVVAFVDTFPATSNGKLDRDGLPWPVEPGSRHVFSTAGGAGTTPVAAQLPVDAVAAGDLTAELCEIFAELLGIGTLDPDEDIWNQGATSFTMVQVSGALRARHGRKVPVSALLADPTVRGIALALTGAPAEPPTERLTEPSTERLTEPSTEPSAGPEPIAAEPAAGFAPVAAQPAEPPAAPPRPGPVDFFSAADRDAFKRARWDLRTPDPAGVCVSLEPADVAGEHYDWRASRREFGARAVERRELSRLLGLLREVETDGRRRRLYPSAGDTYGVQAYVHVRPGGVAGVPEGLYYYHPVAHDLQLITARPELDRSVHFVYNRPVFDEAGFELYLFGRLDAVEPLYGADSERFLLLEAGYLGQLLLLGQTACGVGLCPIGNVALDAVRAGFGLDERYVYLQAFLGGSGTGVAAVAATGERPLFAPAEPPLGAAVDVPQRPTAEVAIVGLAGRFPGADSPEELWSNLSRGTRSLTAVPAHRYGQVVAGGADAGAIGGYLSDVDGFDSLLFHVSPVEAAGLDPQLRLLLHTVWECLERAGHTPGSLGSTGVFLGAMWQDHQQVGADRAGAGEAATVSATASDAANRVSHFFGFTGPSIAVDASCSSSLAALHLAAESLRRGECESAVVAAVNLLTHPYHGQLLRDLGLLAEGLPDGAFDATEAGWSPGEGVAAVLLRARADAGDDVLGIVETTRIGHFGGAGRFGTPQAEPLRRSLRDVLAAAAIDVEDIGYVECAGAGATLADAAEIEALSDVFAARRTPVPIGTVKPNIGHLEAAAGLSQLAKVLLQLRAAQIAPTILSSRPSRLISWSGAGVEPAGRLTPWPETGPPRRALINAVGATGSYGHVVIRAAQRPSEPSRVAAPQVVPLSAQTDAQLADLAGRLHRHLLARPADLTDIAYTLQVGRLPLGKRAVVRAGTTAELTAALGFLARGGRPPAVTTGTARPGGSASTAPDPYAAATDWLAGRPVDWAAYWPAGRARRIALPTYPFATDTYRLGAVPAPAPDRRRPGAPGPAEDYVLRVYAEISGIAVERLDTHVALEDYGLSSYLIAQLNARFAEDLGDVSKTLFFTHRDLAGVAAEIAPLVTGETPVSRTTTVVPRSEPDDDRIAVIGIAGRYPQADDLDEFWSNLLSERDVIGPVPADRRHVDGPRELMVGGFLADVAAFDPLFFGITPRDAALMDPQERLFLQVAWHTLESAGYPRTRLRERHHGRVGVFVGSMYNEYPFFGLASGGDGPAAGSAIAGIANRVSYFLDLNGPSMTVDTMCSSSLTAIHVAVASLQRGECEVALAGGVNLSLHTNKFVQLRDMRMASSDHRCRSFGAGGDGFVPGEGVGAVLLKPLSRARADGDRVLAVVLGSAVNHDGKTNGYTVPSPVAQGSVVLQAMRDAGVSADGIGYLEAHGTGTSLGDPIEIDGLGRAFAEAGLAAGSCAIGSVKSHIGHLEAAAGIAGLTKVVLQFRHGMLAPSRHAEQLNPNVDWSRSPLRVQREAAAWPAGVPRRAGISSFGAGGANAHLIVEAGDATPATPAGPPVAAGPQPVLLSARTADQLRQLAGRLAVHVEGLTDPSALADIAYTSRVGREALPERLAVLATSVAHLSQVLAAFAAGRVHRDVITRGGNGSGPAQQWVDGAAVDWTPAGGGRIVDLPHYPFARMHCWIGESAVDTPAVPLLARDWRPIDAPAPVRAASRDAAGTILCLHRDSQHDLVEAVAAELRPARVVRLVEGRDLTSPQTARTAVRRLLEREPAVTGLLDLCALSDDAGAERDGGPWLARLAVLQELVAARPKGGLRVLQTTSGLFDSPGAAPDLTGARLAGFVRSLGAEHPWVNATVVDLDRPAAADIVTAWRSAEPWGEACLRGGKWYRPCLVPVAEPAGPAWRPDPDRVYVVTGGTRGLGALVANQLVRWGARRLAVLGVRSLPPRHDWSRPDLHGPAVATVRHIQELERLGAQVMVYCGPLDRRAELGGFLDEVRTGLGAIAGVIHCAGQGSQGPAPFARLDLDGVRATLAPKGDGLDTLVDLTSGDRLDRFVLFSSVSSAAGRLAAGVTDYAAANAYLDYTAAARVRSGQPWFRAVNWPVWRETGGGTARPDAATVVGLDALSDADGLAVLERILTMPAAAVTLPCPAAAGGFDAEAVLRVNRTVPDEIRPADAAGTVDLGRAASPGQPPATHVDTLPVARPAPWLAGIFATSLAIPAGQLDHDATFSDLGVESVLLGELLVKIEAGLGQPLEPSLLLEHPTLNRLAAHLGATVAGAPVAGPAGSTPPAAPATAAADRVDGRIAVIGMACRLPGAPDLESFWRLLRQGGSAVTEVPASRWDVAELYRRERATGRSVSKWGGFVDGVEDFDPGYFGMTDDEAKNLDPAIRMTLEATAACLSDAGYTDDELRGRDVGIFMGARMSGYRRRIGTADAASGLGGDQNFIAARVAHQYDLRGPALVVDSACSSALVSVHLAIGSLLAGETPVALAGGVEVLLDEEPYLEFSHARALSPDGRCATFARDANGFVPGEGCGVLLLKPLAAAVRDGDRVHAVIEAVAVGNDGRTMGLTTPNPVAQGQVVRAALARAGRRAAEIGMVEAHGTATMIGDPIELRALTDVYREDTDRAGYCAIGSVKSNVGHLLSAAGVAGLLKLLLAIEHAEIPATLHCADPNPRFDFAASPFFPVTEPRAWPAGDRVGAVSAFGLGGTNAHLIAAAAPASSPARAPLPAPVFHRRRLWWDRPASSAAPEPEPLTTPKQHGNGGSRSRPRPLVASVLDLTFRPVTREAVS
ncbi:hypothetical protein GCM10020218_018920 [Dactylosporangium vinaceum]|uniref:Non-ribosomal peptide synthetase n=1 Tax=Dactylosporangium vinaceum TaxID=53362 RepID=A0ABV5MKM9_9ACTN|nr:non-ribosomal peptide synthetase [Dactylosporangium vinaceum]